MIANSFAKWLKQYKWLYYSNSCPINRLSQHKCDRAYNVVTFIAMFSSIPFFFHKIVLLFSNNPTNTPPPALFPSSNFFSRSFHLLGSILTAYYSFCLCTHMHVHLIKYILKKTYSRYASKRIWNDLITTIKFFEIRQSREPNWIPF